MTPSELLAMTTRMLSLVLLLSLPVVLTAVIVGLLIGLVQAVTQIQDQSIASGAKLVAAFAVIALTAAWGGGELLQFARHAFESIATMR